MAKRIDLNHGIRIATAVALLVAMVLSSQSLRFGDRSVRRDCINTQIGTPVSHPARACATTASSRLERMKAVSSLREQEPGRPANQARGTLDLPTNFRAQPQRYLTYSGPNRPHNPLRC